MTVDELLARVQSVWDGARGSRAMPARADIDAVKLGAALQHVSVIDVVPGDPVDFRYRVVGQQLIKGYGFNLTGQLHTAFADRSLAAWPYYEAYVSCLTSGRPQAIDARTRTRTHVPVNIKGHVWPLSDDGKTVSGLLGAGMFFVPSELLT